MSFYYIYVKTIRKWKNLHFFFKCEKYTSPAVKNTCFYYINVETIGKWKNVANFYFVKSEKIYKSS